MEGERVFVIGDIHGCLEMLKRLLDKIKWCPDQDKLIFLGDYIDRGNDSRGVIEYILKLKNTSSIIQCLMGNHEQLFLEFLDGGDITTFLVNGGMATLNSYLIEDQKPGELVVPVEHIDFLNSLPKWIELEDHFFVHAGLRPGVQIQEQAVEDLLWIREPFIYSDYDFGKKVIFGHTPFPEPFIMENKIGLDTGAVYGNKLTCIELPSAKFHSVEA
jgi:serine/threonine protein phosphatase 1